MSIDDVVAASGAVVERIDLRSGGKPERHIAIVDAAAAALALKAGVAPDRVVLGGRSFGGRMCSMAAAAGTACAGLALISYPLHPPGKPTQLRAAHFRDIRVPCLFVSGTRDAFATPKELEVAAKAILGPVTHVWMEGGNHGLSRRDEEVAIAVRDWLLTLR